MSDTGGERKRASLRWVVTAHDAGMRLDAWLAKRAEVGSRSRARDWIERGKVFRNSDEVTFDRAGERIEDGDEIAVWVDRPGSSRPRSRDVVTRRAALRIIFEDEGFIVADKPPGLLVEPLPGDRSEITLQHLVTDHLQAGLPRRSSRPEVEADSRRAKAGGAGLPRRSSGASGAKAGAQALVVHRIDRDTSGLVVFAKDESAQVALKRQFERRTAERAYVAVLEGRVTPSEGQWKDALVWDKSRLRQRRAREEDEDVAKAAVASYSVVEQMERAAIVEVRLVTGKRNQIRVQAALHRHPLVGERIYRPATGPSSRPAIAFPRQALHAVRLAFRHPRTGTQLRFEAPLPDDLRHLIARLRRS